MEKLSLEVEKNLKLNSQLEETGDSKKVCATTHVQVACACDVHPSLVSSQPAGAP